MELLYALGTLPGTYFIEFAPKSGGGAHFPHVSQRPTTQLANETTGSEWGPLTS